MKDGYQPIILVALLLTALLGCSKDDATAPALVSDQDILKEQVTKIDSVADFSASDEASINDETVQEWESSLAKTTSPVQPILWGRKVENIQRTIAVTIDGDTLATAVMTKMITGRLIILARYPDSSAVDTIQKQFTKEIQRRIRFVRIARTEDKEKNWRPVAITNFLCQTGNKDFGIDEVVIITPRDTITLSDSLMQWYQFGVGPGRIPVLNAGDTMTVRLRVRSENTNSEYAIVRHCAHARLAYRYRTRMGVTDSVMNAGMYEREYEKRFMVRLPMGVDIARYNAVVDVMSAGSLNDDAAPYMNMILGVPYIVVKR